MLSLAGQLNPEVTYLLGDMRSVQLVKTFNAVICLDSINYMLASEDLRATFTTAWHHLNLGGVFLTLPEVTVKSFQQNKTVCRTHTQGDIEITFIENDYDPDPTDTTYEATFIYLIRRGDRLEIETDRHLCGIFELETWHTLLEEAGFEVRQMEFEASASETYPMFVCIKPP